jgi:hypothetical protein
MAILTPAGIRLFIRDNVEENRLIDGVEFTDEDIEHYLEVALGLFNLMPPLSSHTLEGLPKTAKVIVLYGTLANMFGGRAAQAARNQMSYSDGGLTVPIEERYQYYKDLADTYHNLFNRYASTWKTSVNMDNQSSWGEVRSDFSRFPLW